MNDSDEKHYSFFELNKEYYPFEVKIEKLENGHVRLIEKNKNDQSASWYNDYLSDLWFFTSNLKHSIEISNEGTTEQLYGKVFFDTSYGRRWSLSIFETDRVITNPNYV